MEIGGEIPLVLAAGRAWFMNWAVQIAVAVVSWNRPFSLPLRYYQPLRRRVPIWLSRLAVIRLFASIAHIINPHVRSATARSARDGPAQAASLWSVSCVDRHRSCERRSME